MVKTIKKIFNYIKQFLFIFFFIIIFDLLINLFLPRYIKQLVGTERGYSLYSQRFHHEFDSNVKTSGHWGERTYDIFTDQNGFRIGSEEKYNENLQNIGFIGDSFVWGSGINYKNHFISVLNDKKFNYLNLGYVSYSPSIYLKRLEYFINIKKIKFKKIYLFVDHSDIQDEGVFYREDKKGNIVRAYNSDRENQIRHYKHSVKNYLKRNSFIFKFFEILNVRNNSKMTEVSNCIRSNSLNAYKEFLDEDRNNYTISKKLQSEKWVIEGKNKTKNYLNKISKLLKSNDIDLVLVLYPSANEILNKVNENNSFHTIFLKNFFNKNLKGNAKILNTFSFFQFSNDPIIDYKKYWIPCDAHWNEGGHQIIGNAIKNSLQ